MATLTASKVTPLGDGVLIRPRTRDDKTAGGIIIPDTAKEKPQEGIIVAVGPGRRSEKGDRLPMQVELQNAVLYSKYAGTEITVEGVEHLLLKETDILAVLRD